jgi:hypothetical protein
VTTTDQQVTLRTSVWARAVAVVYPMVVAWFVFSRGPIGRLPIPVSGVLFALVLLGAWRRFRIAVIGTADGRLVIRNMWQDLVLLREDVVGVSSGRPSPWRSHILSLQSRDGSTVRLHAALTSFGGPFRGRFERQVAEIRQWTGAPTTSSL